MIISGRKKWEAELAKRNVNWEWLILQDAKYSGHIQGTLLGAIVAGHQMGMVYTWQRDVSQADIWWKNGRIACGKNCLKDGVILEWFLSVSLQPDMQALSYAGLWEMQNNGEEVNLAPA